jgi:hypothetical protein
MVTRTERDESSSELSFTSTDVVGTVSCLDPNSSSPASLFERSFSCSRSTHRNARSPQPPGIERTDGGEGSGRHAVGADASAAGMEVVNGAAGAGSLVGIGAVVAVGAAVACEEGAAAAVEMTGAAAGC